MLPTFVIGLREGLEASLIVGIVAAFLRQRGRSDLLRWVFVGIFSAVALCTAAGVTLDVISRNLPQREQEGLETVIALVAVAMVTYMVVWMKRHSRELKGQLDAAAGVALAAGSGIALVAMAFLAVLREGLETVVFLLAAFHESGSGATAALGAVLGIVTAIALGYAIYRGGVRLNLSKFFRATGVVLVLVAAGLVVSALHTAHEAGWLDFGQQATVDLSGLVAPGSVQSSLLTGMLGFQSRPVLIEVVGWLLYLVPVGLYVAWPPGRTPSRRTVGRLGAGLAVAGAVGAIVVTLVVPGRPDSHPSTVAAGTVTQVVSRSADRAVVATSWLRPAQRDVGPVAVRLVTHRIGSESPHGLATVLYRATRASVVDGPARMTLQHLAVLGGGRLPLGVASRGSSADATTTVPVTRHSRDVATVHVAARTGQVLDVRWVERVTLVAHFDIGDATVGSPRTAITQFTPTEASAATAAARHDIATLDRREALIAVGVLATATAAAGLLLALGALLRGRQGRPAPSGTSAPSGAPTRPSASPSR
jgi:high-affinity iron transporter